MFDEIEDLPPPQATYAAILERYRHPASPQAEQRVRLGLVVATQLLFYGLPWLTWNARPAVLFDLASRKFYILGMVLWPQDFIFLAGLLVISALSLFLFTAVGGRLFCGYACPQTVYTEIFLWIERKIEGNLPSEPTSFGTHDSLTVPPVTV